MKIFCVLIITIILYQIIVSIFLPSNFLPSISELFSSAITLFSNRNIYLDISSSLVRVIIGFIIASIVGIFLGLGLAYDNRLGDLKFVIDLVRPIPPIAWIPLAILIFGLGNNSAFFIVFLGAFFPIFTSTYFGALSIPVIYKNISSSFELGRCTYFSRILIPFSLPYIFTGLRIGIGMAWMSVIAAEMIGSQNGLGYFIQLNRLLLRTDNIIFGMVLIGAVGFMLQKIMEFIEKKIVIWN